MKRVFQASFILQVHLGPVSARLEHDQNYRNVEQNEGKELGSHKFLKIETAPNHSNSSLTDSLGKPTQSAARIHQDSRARSLEKKRTKEFGDSKFGVSVLSPKTHKPRRSCSDGSMKPGRSYSDGSVHDAAAIRIQTDFRGYKCRKQHLITKQGIVLIQVKCLITNEMFLVGFSYQLINGFNWQARWRGYQVRKSYRKLVLSMGLVEA